MVAAIAAECPGGGEPPPGVVLPPLPSSYMSLMMMNIQHPAAIGGKGSPGSTKSVYEVTDPGKMRALLLTMEEVELVTPENVTYQEILEEQVLWNPMLSGVRNFLSITSLDEQGKRGDFCMADSMRPDSFIGWLFGFDPANPGESLPSLSGMIHENTNYTVGCSTVKRGIPVNTFQGLWDIPAWDARLTVNYYWSDPDHWGSSSGEGRAVPVTAELEGMATIGGATDVLKMTIDYTDFFEVSLPAEAFSPPSDLWCEGRRMDDTITGVPEQLSFSSEIVITWKSGEAAARHVVIPRREWFFPQGQISRTDYKPLDFSNHLDPFDGHSGLVSQIDDFITGLSYTIDLDLGNCTVSTLEDSEDFGNTIQEGGRIHMRNPFYLITQGAKFAFNGVYPERSVEMDAYLHTGPVFPDQADSPNETTVFYLSNSDYEIQDGHVPERLIPTKMVRYLTMKYNEAAYKASMNIFHFSRSPGDFSMYDISACYEDSHKLHLMVRMGWSLDMDIEGTEELFRGSVRESVVIWGKVTPIRVVNIEYSTDPAHSAFYLLFTVLDYPPNTDIELNDLPDAVRPNSEVKSNIVAAVDKGWFKVIVYLNDGQGGKIISVAEPGSTRQMGDRDGAYTHTVGYSSGAMAALGIILLLVTVSGVLALLVYVLKW